MKTIALRGKSNSGKTATILEIIKCFKNDKMFKGYISHIDSGKKEDTVLIQYRNKTILVTSRGDTTQLLEKMIKEAKQIIKKKPIDLFVCACHNGSTTDFIKRKSKKYIFHSIWYVEGDDRIVHEIHKYQAERLFDLIVRDIKKK